MYVAAGRSVVVPRASCPSCGLVMGWWSGYERSVRVGGRCWRLWLARARCRACRVTHTLVPSFLLVGRLDVVDTIGSVVAAVAGGRSGVRPVAAVVDVPYTTARGWVRVFRGRAQVLWSGFAAVTVELGGDIATNWGADVDRAAVAMIVCAHRAAAGRHEVLTPPLWVFAGLVSGGMLIRSNTDPPWRLFGSRRFIAPIPFSGS